MNRLYPAIAAVLLASAASAPAVIVSGVSGTGNNNDDVADLQSYLSSASQPDFPYWDNLVRVSNASGVYLGADSSSGTGWVLSANHISPEPATITVAGSVYTASAGIQIGSSDLILYQIGGGLGDPALPSLPAVPLASITASAGESALMFGRGFAINTSAPYIWGTPGTSDANGTRWATNTIELTAMVDLGGSNLQPYLVTDFDASGDPGATAYDGQASLGDSGGGLFILRGGVWELAGIAHFVDDGPDFLESVATGDNTLNPSQTGDYSAYSDVFAKSGDIITVTGVLVPEPASALLVVGALPLLLRRKR
ncbi:hypothetical protein [Haloferula sargassicola]|uniref:PEP-CTERM protein-sorting domain-containing protein n=1 Tax=Haloferula sargassicola TaxID=490096 RepID=A0ABP9UUQ9_9BACT